MIGFLELLIWFPFTERIHSDVYPHKCQGNRNYYSSYDL